MDVRDLKAIRSLPEQLPAEFQEVDILVNNAGLALGTAGIHENDLDDIETMVQTNITSLLYFCRVFTPGMVKVRFGDLELGLVVRVHTTTACLDRSYNRLPRPHSPFSAQRNRGHVINMCSIAGHEAYVGGSVYCGSKHAVDAITKASRHDLVGTRVRVTSISPGRLSTREVLVGSTVESHLVSGYSV